MKFSNPIGLIPCYAGEQITLGGGEIEGNPVAVQSLVQVYWGSKTADRGAPNNINSDDQG